MVNQFSSIERKRTVSIQTNHSSSMCLSMRWESMIYSGCVCTVCVFYLHWPEHCKPMLCCNRFSVFIHTQIDTHTVTHTHSLTCIRTNHFLHVIGSPVPLSFFLFLMRSVFVSHSIYRVSLFHLPPRIFCTDVFFSCSVFLDSLSLHSILSSVSLCCHFVYDSFLTHKKYDDP